MQVPVFWDEPIGNGDCYFSWTCLLSDQACLCDRSSDVWPFHSHFLSSNDSSIVYVGSWWNCCRNHRLCGVNPNKTDLDRNLHYDFISVNNSFSCSISLNRSHTPRSIAKDGGVPFYGTFWESGSKMKREIVDFKRPEFFDSCLKLGWQLLRDRRVVCFKVSQRVGWFMTSD